jgi:hypothetical protein
VTTAQMTAPEGPRGRMPLLKLIYRLVASFWTEQSRLVDVWDDVTNSVVN